MNISLNPNLEKFIHQKVKEGNYNSASEVVREALRIMIERDAHFKQQLKKLNHDIAIGLQQLSEGKRIEGRKAFKELKETLEKNPK